MFWGAILWTAIRRTIGKPSSVMRLAYEPRKTSGAEFLWESFNGFRAIAPLISIAPNRAACDALLSLMTKRRTQNFDASETAACNASIESILAYQD
jgi:hypothetical protein